MASAAGLSRWRYSTQNRFFEQLRRLAPESEEKIRLVGEIDEAMKAGAGHPMGPLTLADFVGLDTLGSICDVLFDELDKTTGHDPRLDAHVAALRQALGGADDPETIQYRARQLAEDISLALQGSLLVRFGHPAVAEAFLASRVGGQWGGAFGTLPTGLDLGPILERALVKG